MPSRWAPLGERWFGDLCFYGDARAGLVNNAHAVLDPHVFGDAFEASLDAFDSWDKVGRRCLHCIKRLSEAEVAWMYSQLQYIDQGMI